MRLRDPPRFWRLVNYARQPAPSSTLTRSSCRAYSQTKDRVSDFAFAFDIDGVLLRSAKPIRGAASTLARLKEDKVPFVLLTNGGGQHEEDRVAVLRRRLADGPMHEEPAIDTSNFIQSHTPFESMANEPMGEKCVLVVGGESSKCREVATKYGFKNVVTPSDIYTAHRKSRTGDVSPFSRPFAEYHESASQSSMPMPISSNPKTSPSLQIGAIFVFHDSRDWGLDIQIILDVLLSHHGIIGTLSERNGDTSLPNNGYQQDGQPPIYFSNADLWWAADYRLPRLGQGGFRAALEGVWAAVTGGAEAGVELHKTVIGKPYPLTYEFAEKRLLAHRKTLLGPDAPPLKTVYMIGDNPESDVRGANSWQSPEGIEWRSILVGTGVYNMNTRPSCTPWATCKSILRAVDMAARTSGWHDGPEDYVKIRRRDRIIRLKRDRGEQRQQDGVQEEEEEVVGETPVSYAGRP